MCQGAEGGRVSERGEEDRWSCASGRRVEKLLDHLFHLLWPILVILLRVLGEGDIGASAGEMEGVKQVLPRGADSRSIRDFVDHLIQQCVRRKKKMKFIGKNSNQWFECPVKDQGLNHNWTEMLQWNLTGRILHKQTPYRCWS